jgi:hypothetical protein
MAFMYVDFQGFACVRSPFLAGGYFQGWSGLTVGWPQGVCLRRGAKRRRWRYWEKGSRRCNSFMFKGLVREVWL